VARLRLADKVKLRTGIRTRCASGPGRDAEIVRNVLAPHGFGRRRAIGGVAAAWAWKAIAFAASPTR
jgi:hypothetical protein